MLLHVPQYPQLFNSQLEIACRIQISLVYFASMKWSALSYKSSDRDEVVLCIISELLVRKCYCNLAWKHCLSHCHHLGEFFLPIFSWCTKIRHGWESNFNFCTLIKTARVKSLVFDDQNTHTYLFCLGLHGCAGTRKEKNNADFTEARDSEWQWHQLGSAPHHSVFYRPDALPAAQPTASKHWRLARWSEMKSNFSECYIAVRPTFVSVVELMLHCSSCSVLMSCHCAVCCLTCRATHLLSSP